MIKAQWLRTGAANAIVDACERDIAALRTEFEETLERHVAEARRKATDLEESCRLARERELDTLHAYDAARDAHQRANTDRAAAAISAGQRERNLRRQLEEAQNARLRQCQADVDRAWREYKPQRAAADTFGAFADVD